MCRIRPWARRKSGRSHRDVLLPSRCRIQLTLHLIRGGQAMAKPAVIIVGADKGGVGKTTVSRTGTLKRFHPDVTEVVDMTAIPDQMKVFDTLNATDASVTVIDVRAGLLSPTLRALRD